MTLQDVKITRAGEEGRKAPLPGAVTLPCISSRMVRVTFRPPSETFDSISYRGQETALAGGEPRRRRRQQHSRITWGQRGKDGYGSDRPVLPHGFATTFTQKPWQDQRAKCLKWHCQMPKMKLRPAEPVDAAAGSSCSPAHDGAAWPKTDCGVGTLKDPRHQPSKTKFTIPSRNGCSDLDQWVL